MDIFWILFFIAIHLIFCGLAWNAVRLMHKHVWTTINPQAIDVVVVILPFFNIVLCIGCYSILFISVFSPKDIDYNKFFRIDKRP